jgi:cell wall assembly regulator SMI1
MTRSSAEAIQRHLAKFATPISPPPSKSIAESWQRIVAWLSENAGGAPRLNPGASEQAIREFEAEIGATLPGDFKESLRLHDGGRWWIPCEGEFLSLAGIQAQWSQYVEWQRGDTYGKEERLIPRDFEGPIKAIWWSPRRIPLTESSGDGLMLDLDPSEGGDYGQAIHYNHEVGPTDVRAPSWSAFLARLAVDLEAGKYVYFPQFCDLEPLEWQLKRGR